MTYSSSFKPSGSSDVGIQAQSRITIREGSPHHSSSCQRIQNPRSINGAAPHFWLLKTEPNCWSWDQQTAATTTGWDDVRNFQAQKYLKAMHKGDQAFFYHTGNERRIVGIVEITREAYPDSTDPSGRFIMVDVKTLQPFLHPITLSQMKAEPRLAHLPLITQGRLSVMPIDRESWQLLCQWGGV